MLNSVTVFFTKDIEEMPKMSVEDNPVRRDRDHINHNLHLA